MKAIVCTQYGPPELLQYKDVAKPNPESNQVLVRVCAASLNPLDWRLMRGDPWIVRLFFGLRKPKFEILGSDFSGLVEEVGDAVTQFQPGDAVFGAKGFAGTAFAEFLCAPEEQVVLKPANVSFEAAASVPVAAVTALQGLRDRGHIQAGQKVLIDGASGGVGTFAVQIAKAYGAEVTAVCSTGKMETARSIGADHVIDYTQQDFTRAAPRYDLILAANARHSVLDYLRALKPNGICVKAGGEPTLSGMLEDLFLAPVFSRTSRKKSCSFIAKFTKTDLLALQDLLATGKIVPVIDRCYPLSKTAEAIGYLEEGHARGKVVINVETV